jgi:hypothetical protein
MSKLHTENVFEISVSKFIFHKICNFKNEQVAQLRLIVT